MVKQAQKIFFSTDFYAVLGVDAMKTVSKSARSAATSIRLKENCALPTIPQVIWFEQKVFSKTARSGNTYLHFLTWFFVALFCQTYPTVHLREIFLIWINFVVFSFCLEESFYSSLLSFLRWSSRILTASVTCKQFKIWAEIHQALLAQFYRLAESFIGKVPVKD